MWALGVIQTVSATMGTTALISGAKEVVGVSYAGGGAMGGTRGVVKGSCRKRKVKSHCLILSIQCCVDNLMGNFFCKVLFSVLKFVLVVYIIIP